MSGNQNGAFGLQQILPGPLDANPPKLLVAVPDAGTGVKFEFVGVPKKVGKIGFTAKQKGGDTLSRQHFMAS